MKGLGVSLLRGSLVMNLTFVGGLALSQSSNPEQVIEPSGELPLSADSLRTELRIVDADLLTAAIENGLVFSQGRILTRQQAITLGEAQRSRGSVAVCGFAEGPTEGLTSGNILFSSEVEMTASQDEAARPATRTSMSFTAAGVQLVLDCRTIGEQKLLSLESISEVLGNQVVTLKRGESRFRSAISRMAPSEVEATGSQCSSRTIGVISKFDASADTLTGLLEVNGSGISSLLEGRLLGYIPQLMQAHNSLIDQLRELCQEFGRVELPESCTIRQGQNQEDSISIQTLKTLCERSIPERVQRIRVVNSARTQ